MEKKETVNYEILKEYHDYEGKKYVDLVCYINGHRFVLVPLTKSVSSRAYFYALLNGVAVRQ